MIMGNPDVDFVYCHELDGKVFRLDTREVKQDLEDVSIQHPRVIRYLADLIRESVAEVRQGGSLQ